MATLSLPDEPELTFRQLHHELHAFASQTMDDDDALAFMTRLLGHESQLLAPVALPPPQSSERQALLSESKVLVAGKSIDVSPLIQQEILKLSDEFRVSEARAVELWFLASDAAKREWVERVDQLPQTSIANSIAAAARHFLISEIESKLHLLKELMRLRFDDRLDKKRRQFVLSYTNKLLQEGLLTKLLAAVQDLLPKLLEIAPVAQAASYWHNVLADTVLFIVSSAHVLPAEVQQMVEAVKAVCTRLNTVVTKVSPHIVNLTSFTQLFETGSLAGAAPQGVVKQVSCILRALTTLQVALIVVLLEKSNGVGKINRNSGAVEAGNALAGAANAPKVRDLHRLIMEDAWDHKTFQSVTMLAWAAFLASQIDPSGASSTMSTSSNVLGRSAASGNVFAEVEQAPRVVKAALECQVFTSLVEVLLKYLPDSKHDPLLYGIFETQLQSLFVNYSSKLMVDVPTVADQAALAQMQAESDGEVATWEGDCLENIVEYAIALCDRDESFARAFWPMDDAPDSHMDAAGSEYELVFGDGNCHEFLLSCRDAAQKNPASLSPYLKLVAAAAQGQECAQLAFHHMKQNPSLLSWDHFFAVMAKYQRLLTEAERPNANYSILSGSIAAGVPGNDVNRNAPGQKFIRPRELEALEAIQAVIQGVIHDHQLALIFFHNHDWSPIQSFVTFLQCRVPSSLKGELMKTLSLFAQVPEIAPFVWRHMDALQILRTTADVAVYGNQDISYELEHYESLSRRYPATRGFLALLNELFDNPHAWNAFEGDGRVAAIQYYFEFLLEKVFLKFDLRKYEYEDEKWSLVNGVLGIFRRVLRQKGSSAAEGGFAYQLLQRLLSGGSLLEKILSILSADGGVDGLESTATNVHLEHAFFFCLDYSKKQTEATYGALSLSGEAVSSIRRKTFVSKDPWSDISVVPPRQRSVQIALEILVLVLERDAHFVHSDVHRQLSVRVQVEMLHNILFRYRNEFLHIIQYIKFTKSVYIPELSVAILRAVSNRVAGHTLVDLLADSGASGEVMMGYMNRLLNVYADNDGFHDDEPVVNEGDEEASSGTVKFQTPKKRRRRASSPRERGISSSAALSASGERIRSIILDLVAENLEKPAPNLSHLLLGMLNGESSLASIGSGYLSSGLDVVLTLLASPDFGLEYPDLAQKCYKIVYKLLVQDYSSRAVSTVLESPHCHFFETQLRLFTSVYHLKRRRSAHDVIGELNMRGWFFKALAVYVHSVLQREPTHIKKVNRLMSLLLLSSDDVDTARQAKMLLLRLFHESSLDLYPPEVPSNQQAVAVAEQVTKTVDEGYFKWLKIDVERFCEAIQSGEFEMYADGGFGALSAKRMRSSARGAGSSPRSASPSSPTELLLQWAIDWNMYSERVAAESHALNSVRELTEVVVLDYLCRQDEDPSIGWMGLDVIASDEVRGELLTGIASTILAKLTDRPQGSAQLYEILAKLLLLLFSEVRHMPNRFSGRGDSQVRQCAPYVDLLVKAIGNTTTATGNPVAAQNARTLLYSCLVNLLGPSFMSPQQNPDLIALLQSGGSLANPTRGNVLTGQILDLICRDSSESGDVLSMGLAVSALEAIVAATGVPAAKSLRERGYLLHLIGLFRKLCEMDAAFDRDPSCSGTSAPRHAPAGIDATTVGTMYECFLSMFTRIASKLEGAIALLEGGIVRSLCDLTNLPSHRPRHVFPGESGVGISNVDAFRRAEAIYTRKWLPVVQLVSTLCASLPQNRALCQQVLQLITKQKKLFTGCLKLDQHEKPSLVLLRETSYTTFVFRYVVQFPDLCEKELNSVKWDKIAQGILRVFLLYSSEITPFDEANDQMSDNDSVWWSKTQPRLPNEQRDDTVLRIPSSELEEELLERCNAARSVVGLLHLTAFGEEKLYTSRMILCNTIAFCATRMLKSFDAATRLLPGKSVLLASSTIRTATNGFSASKFSTPDSVDRRAFVGSIDPMWVHAPAIGECALRLKIAVDAVETAKAVATELQSVTESHRRSIAPVDVSFLQNLLEYDADSLTFVIENMTIVLWTHFAHYVSHQPADAAKATVQPVLHKVIETLGSIESNKFVHAIARRLRDLVSTSA